MFSRRGISTIQSYMCYSVNKHNAQPPWMKPPKTTDVNPERMNRGITREEYRQLENANADNGSDSSEDFESRIPMVADAKE